MSETAEIKKNIREKLQFMNDYFINQTVQSVLTGKDAINNGNESHIHSFIEDIFSYDRFTNSDTPFKGLIDIDMNTIKTGILIKNANKDNESYSEFKNITTTPENWKISKGGPDDILTSAYNFTPLLLNINAVTGYINFKRENIETIEGGAPVSILDILNSLRITYNILETGNLNNYISKKSLNQKTLDLPISMYSIQKNTNDVYAYDTTNVISMIENYTRPIIDINKLSLYIDTTRVEAIRRLVLLYETIIHVYLSLYLLEKATVPGNNENKSVVSARVIMYDICYDIVNQFIKRNDSIGKIGGDVYNLMKDMQKRISKYKQNKVNIENENNELVGLKSDIIFEKDLLNVSNKYSNKSKAIYYFYSILSILIISSAIYMLYSPNVPYNIKKFVVSILVAVSIVLFIAMQIIKKYVLTETFVISPSISRADINNKQELLSDRTTLLTTLNEEILKYLNNTINVVSFMESYKTYGNINYSMGKEYQYYKNLNDVLFNDKNKMDQANRVNYYNSYVTRYRIYFFITLLLTITILSLLSIYAPAGQDFFTILGIVILIIITYLYIVNVNNLVRTDGKKLYWGHPDKNTF